MIFSTTFWRLCLVTAAIALLTPATSRAEAPQWLLGNWVLDSQKTHELQPEQKSGGGGGFGSPSISVGGLPIPLPSGALPGSGAPRDPRVLRCAEMTVAMTDDHVHFAYLGVGEEIMKSGNDQGRKTTWSRSRLTQKYATTTRKVTKSYELEEDGSLLVKVKISPKGSKSATHVRVFRRPAV